MNFLFQSNFAFNVPLIKSPGYNLDMNTRFVCHLSFIDPITIAIITSHQVAIGNLLQDIGISFNGKYKLSRSGTIQRGKNFSFQQIIYDLLSEHFHW